MREVLISIQPKWVEKICRGEKTVEVRKTKPKCETPFKCYIYCTKGKPTFSQSAFCDEVSNGKVIGEFVCDSIYHYRYTKPFLYYGEKMYHTNEHCTKACLSWQELEDYLGNKDGYGWHITDLVVYDEPRELSEFKRFVDRSKGQRYHEDMLYLQTPPQSWCYITTEPRQTAD